MFLSASRQTIFAVSKSCCLAKEREKGRSDNSFQKSVALKMALFKTETYSSLFLKNNSVRSWGWVVSRTHGRGGSSALRRPPCILCYPSSISVCLCREISTPPHAGRIGDFPRFLYSYSPLLPPLDLFDRFQRSTAYCFSLFHVRKFW